MKAVLIYDYGGIEQLKFEESVPDPQPDANSVLIETAAASVNPIDWKMRSGEARQRFPLKLPAILGRDVSGVVRSVGRDVRNFRPGDRVAAMTNATYAELVAVDAAQVTHLPVGVDLADAAAIPLIALTGDQLIRRATTLAKDQTVLITGALGSVGRAAVHTAVKLGARVIAGVRQSQLEAARSLPAVDVIALDDAAAVDKLKPVDVVADTVGGEAGGRLLGKIVSGGSFGYAAMIPEGAAEKYPAVKVTRVLAQPDPAKVREFADDIRDGKFLLPIAARLPLRHAADAQRMAEKGGVGKVLLLAR